MFATDSPEAWLPFLWGLVQEDIYWVGRTVLAGILAALIGTEREQAGKAAGLRTHMLVGMAACTFASIGDLIAGDLKNLDFIRLDPSRVVAAVATGIGFLGAGIIFVAPRQNQVHGLTTAASIWATSSIAVAVAFRHYVFAVVMTAILYFVLHGLARFSHQTNSSLSGD